MNLTEYLKNNNIEQLIKYLYTDYFYNILTQKYFSLFIFNNNNLKININEITSFTPELIYLCSTINNIVEPFINNITQLVYRSSRYSDNDFLINNLILYICKDNQELQDELLEYLNKIKLLSVNSTYNNAIGSNSLESILNYISITEYFNDCRTISFLNNQRYERLFNLLIYLSNLQNDKLSLKECFEECNNIINYLLLEIEMYLIKIKIDNKAPQSIKSYLIKLKKKMLYGFNLNGSRFEKFSKSDMHYNIVIFIFNLLFDKMNNIMNNIYLSDQYNAIVSILIHNQKRINLYNECLQLVYNINEIIKDSAKLKINNYYSNRSDLNGINNTICSHVKKYKIKRKVINLYDGTK